MRRIRYMYIRDAKWNPIGCVAIVVNRSKNRLEYGLSMRHPKDAINHKNGKRKAFDRKLAQGLAVADLVRDIKWTHIEYDATMHDITAAVMQDIIAHNEAPSGAIKFAKNWLSTTSILYEPIYD